MIDGTGRVAALDGPAKPDDVQPSEGGDVTALPATSMWDDPIVDWEAFVLSLEEDPEP